MTPSRSEEAVDTTRAVESAAASAGAAAFAAPVTAHDTADGRLLQRLRFRLRVSGVGPALSLAFWACAVTLGAATGWVTDRAFSPSAREQRRRERAERAGAALARRLGRLRGAFAKAGQFAAVRHDVVPAHWSNALASLQDRVAPMSFDDARAIVERELGAPLEVRFRSFSREPVGAASVAQVHRAELADGAEVAVKVQYPWIEAALPADLALLGWLARFLARRSKRAQLDLAGLIGEFESSLRAEFDFRVEAEHAREIAANLAGDPQIVVPEPIPSLCTARVLSMPFFDAVRIDDLPGLTKLGVTPRELLEVLARAYAKQVFVDGLFHADPHPGNLFALPRDDAGRARVLFVDFGLSKRLSPELRRELRLGIYALIQRQPDELIARMRGMGMIAPGAESEVKRAVLHMFERIATQSSGGGALAIATSQVLGLKDEAVALLRETQGLQLPNDLLLYAKTLSYLFALGERLDPDVDLMKLTLPYLLRFLATRDA